MIFDYRFNFFFYSFNSFGDLLFPLLKSLLKKSIGPLNDGTRMACDFLVSNFRIGSGKDGFSLYRMWSKVPTNSSSTLWFSAAEVSVYLASYWLAISNASANKIWNRFWYQINIHTIVNKDIDIEHIISKLVSCPNCSSF